MGTLYFLLPIVATVALISFIIARINTQLDLHRIFNVADKFVPNAFLHSLNRERLTEVMLGDHTEREVTVLFADIRDYTVLAETMTPEENFRFVNAFHGRMGPVIQQNNGYCYVATYGKCEVG